MSTQPIPWDQFAKSVRDKYPGAYDHMSDSQLVGAVVAKYPQYKGQLANYQPTQFEKDRSGGQSALSAIGSDLKGFAPSSPSPYPMMDMEAKSKIADSAHAADESRKAAGYSPAYRVAAGIGAPMIGLNASGMEDAAAKGNTEGFGHAMTPLVVAGAAKGVSMIPEAAAGIKPAARSALLDPVTGKPTVTPGPILERMLRTPEETQDALMNQKAEGFEGARKLDEQARAKYTQEGKAVPLTNSPYANQHEAAANFAAGKPGPYNHLRTTPYADYAPPTEGSPFGAPRVQPEDPLKPLRPLVGTPEEWAAYEQKKAILKPEASDAGLYSAARGSAKKQTTYQQRLNRKFEDEL